MVRRTPFTIRLLYSTTENANSLTLGIVTGSSKVGSAVVEADGNVLYISETEIRNDTENKMTQRSKYRKNSIKNDRFSPTMASKLNVHINTPSLVIVPI